MSNLTKHLEEIEVDIDDLFLDPNNPRLFSRPSIKKIPDEEIIETHDLLLKKFSSAPDSKSNEEDGGLDLSALKKSIKQIGFVNIDSLVVRPIDGNPSKYVVLEGNRRLAAILSVRSGNLTEEVAKTIEKIKVYCISKSNISSELFVRLENMVLGIRHHSPMLQWDPYPRAVNIFKEYQKMYLSSKGETIDDTNIVIENSLCLSVATQLSIKANDVKRALVTLSAYRQCEDGELSVKPRHFSLIQSVVTNSTILKKYLLMQTNRTLFHEDALERIDKLCQFSLRDASDFANQKILKDPKSASNFAKVLNAADNPSERIKSEAKYNLQKLFEEDLEDGETAISLEDAVNNINKAKRAAKWKELVLELLKQVEQDDGRLLYESYTNEGRDLRAREKLEEQLPPFRSIFLGS